MRSLLLTRRWLGFTVFALIVVAACFRLGIWQLHRGEGRSAYNADLAVRSAAAPVAADSVLTAGRRPPADLQWRRVTATGHYAPEDTVLIRNRVQDSQPGFEVLVPLVDAAGTALLVDRGWLPRTGSATGRTTVPPPPDGTVTVTGRVRTGQQVGGRSGLGLASGGQTSVRRVDPLVLGAVLDRSVYGGYVEATAENPAPPAALAPLRDPDTQNSGLNYAYFVQWEVFALIGAVGWVLLLRREAQDEAKAPWTAPRDAGRDRDREEQAWPA